jgi:hypothetical protein
MIDPALERRVIDAFSDARASVDASPDLYARITLSLEEAAARRRFRRRLAAGISAFVAANALLAALLSDQGEGTTMPWWVIELITNIVLVALAIGLGPFIKRFGRSYAADVFRATPRTGKSYLVLTDVAYYLMFTAFILFTVTFVEPADWAVSTGNQLKHELARIGGILLIMGILHTGNVVALPVIGRLLSGPRPRRGGGGGADAPPPTVTTPPLGPGTWLLRIEPTPAPPDAPDGPA